MSNIWSQYFFVAKSPMSLEWKGNRIPLNGSSQQSCPFIYLILIILSHQVKTMCCFCHKPLCMRHLWLICPPCLSGGSEKLDPLALSNNASWALARKRASQDCSSSRLAEEVINISFLREEEEEAADYLLGTSFQYRHRHGCLFLLQRTWQLITACQIDFSAEQKANCTY